MPDVVELELLPSKKQKVDLHKCCDFARKVYNKALDAVDKHPGRELWDTEQLHKTLAREYGEKWSSDVPSVIVRGSLQLLSDVLSEPDILPVKWDMDEEFFALAPTQGATVTKDQVVLPLAGSIGYVAGEEDRGKCSTGTLGEIMAVYEGDDGEHRTYVGSWLALVAIGE